MSKITLANSKTFSSEPSETILDAALRAGLILEHSCRTGRCGACKAPLLGGSSESVGSEVALTSAERESGWVLSCVRVATSDVQLGVEDLGDIKIYPAKTLACRIRSLDYLSPDVLRVVLRLPPNQKFEYHPGQYFDLIGKDALRRSYSVANAPIGDHMIELHIRQVRDGEMSRYLFEEAKIDDLLRLYGPLGTFFLRDVAGRDLLLLATGTGMAPIKAILEGMNSWSAKLLPRSVSVFWGARVASDLYWDPRGSGLELAYFPVLSRADSTWAGLRGHVQEAVLNTSPNLSEAVVYACGSIEMIEGAREQLIANGLSDRQFHSDAFVASEHGSTA